MVRNYGYRKSYQSSVDFSDPFWNKVDRSAGPASCWSWTGARNQGGYGRGHWVGPTYAHTTFAHRRAYELAIGPIPDGLDICHSCDNPPCCNPTHLWSGTARDNLRDAVAKGRLTAVFRTGDRATNHKLTWPAVRAIRARYAAGGESHRSLGREYGVSGVAIHLIVKGKTWPEPTSESPSSVRAAR